MFHVVQHMRVALPLWNTCWGNTKKVKEKEKESKLKLWFVNDCPLYQFIIIPWHIYWGGDWVLHPSHLFTSTYIHSHPLTLALIHVPWLFLIHISKWCTPIEGSVCTFERSTCTFELVLFTPSFTLLEFKVTMKYLRIYLMVCP